MDVSQLEAEQASIKEDILKLQLHSVPLNLSWDSQGEEEEEDDLFDEDSYLFSVIDDSNQASTSGVNSGAGTSGLNSGPASAPQSVLTTQAEDDENLTLQEGEEELIDLSKDLEASPENMLKLNMAYQEVLQQQLHVIEELILQNKCKQTELISAKEDSAFEQNVSSSRSKADLGLSLAPFFKNSTMYVQTLMNYAPMPLHSDTQRRMHELGIQFIENALPAIKWKKEEEKKLKDGVARVALRQMTEPLLSNLEYMEEKREKSGDKEMRKKIEEVKKKVEAAKRSSEATLAGDRSTEHDWAAIANIDLEGQRTATECILKWKNDLHPSINKSDWTNQEDANLKRIVKKYKERNWKAIASDLGTGRTPMQCIQRYQSKNPDHKVKPWTPEEDKKLKKLVDKYRVGSVIPHTLIAIKMGNRSSGQVCHRWVRSVDPSFKRTKWTTPEDIALLQAIAKYGTRWAMIRDSGMVPGRNDAQCRERYENSLRNVNRDPWSKSEDAKIAALVEEVGEGKWSMISQALNRRTDNQVYHRWKYIKRSKQQGTPIKYRPKGPKTITDSLMIVRQKLIETIEEKLSKANNGTASKDISQPELAFENENTPEDENAKLPTNQIIRIGGQKKRLIGTELEKRLTEAKTPKEIIDLYHELSQAVETDKQEHRRDRIKNGHWTRTDKVMNDKLMALINANYKPFKRLANTKGTNINEILKKVQLTLKKINTKVMFIHYVKAMNINAEGTLQVIKAEKPDQTISDKPPVPVHKDGTAEINGDQSKTGNVTPRPPFSRNHFLPLCAPNLATVSAYRRLMLDKERRVKTAKLMLVDKNGNSGKGKAKKASLLAIQGPQDSVNGLEQLYNGVKYRPEKLMRNVQLMPEHRILRSRFVSLFAWPTVLSTLVPYERTGAMRILRPVMKIPRKVPDSDKMEESSDDEQPISSKRLKMAN